MSRKLTDEEKRDVLSRIKPTTNKIKRLIWNEEWTRIIAIEEEEPDRDLDLFAKE